MEKVIFKNKVDLSLTERDLRTIICALDDYGAMLCKSRCFKEASYVDRLSRELYSIKVMSL